MASVNHHRAGWPGLLGMTLLSIATAGCRQAPVASPPEPANVTRALTRQATQHDGSPLAVVQDGDGETGLELDSRKVLSIPLYARADVTGVAVLTTGPVKLRARLETAAGDHLADQEALDLQAPGWHLVPLRAKGTDVVKLSVEPVSGLPQLSEVQVWAAGEGTLAAPASALLSRIADPGSSKFKLLPDHGTLAPAGSGDADQGAATCLEATVEIDLPTAQLGRALLAFKGRGLAESFSVEVSVNDRGTLPAALLRASSDLQPYARRIPALWLQQGSNSVRLCGSPAGGRVALLQDLTLLLEVERAPVADVSEGPLAALVDGIGATSVHGAAEVHIPFRRTSTLYGVTLAHSEGLDAHRVTVFADGAPVRPDAVQAVVGGSQLLFLAGARVETTLTLATAGGVLKDVEVQAAGLGRAWPRPVLFLDHPRAHRHFSGTGVISGFVEGLSPDAPAVQAVAGGPELTGPVETLGQGGAFLLVVRRLATEGGFAADLRVEAAGVPLNRRVAFLENAWAPGASTGGGNAADIQAELQRMQFGAEGDVARATVTPGRGGEVVLGTRVRLTVPPGAVERDQELRIRRADKHGLARLNPGMVNVTAPRGAGYQFLPSPTQFQQPVSIIVPYDEDLIPRGKGPQDVRTYFYSEEEGAYVPLERVHVDADHQTVVSLTDHFTDMINAVLVQPESPTPETFNPNSVSSLAVADPTANMTLVAPPSVNNTGTASVSYPFRLPKARGRYQPQLALQYTSEGGWGIAGEGWNLRVSSIDVDTKFGAARYEGLFPGSSQLEPLFNAIGAPPPPGLVGERYLLDGEELVPTTGGGSCTRFRLRREGRFARIERCGVGHDGFYWVVTDKDGTRMVYGNREQSRLQPQTCLGVTGPRPIARWYLDHVVDVDGNGTRFTYADAGTCPLDTHPPDSRGITAQRRLARVEYTFDGSDWMNSTAEGGHYAVEVSYAPRTMALQVPGSSSALEIPVDERLDARAGFPVLQDGKLSRVLVKCRGAVCQGNPEVIRSYRFQYDNPDASTLFKLRLKAVEECPGGACSDPHVTQFGYTVPKNEMGTPGEGEGTGTGELWRLPPGAPPVLSMSANAGAGGGGNVGIGTPIALDRHKGVVLSGNAAGSLSGDVTVVQFMDLNGDGLPDQISTIEPGLFDGTPLKALMPASAVAFNTGKPSRGASDQSFVDDPMASGVSLGTDPTLAGRLPLPTPLGNDASLGLSAGGMLNVGLDVIGVTTNVGANVSVQAGLGFPTDVNGDGLVDLVAGPVSFVQQRMNIGTPEAPREVITFIPEQLTGSTASCPGVDVLTSTTNALAGQAVESAGQPNINPQAVLGQLQEAVGRRDQLLRWRAPRPGEVTVAVAAERLLSCSALDGEQPSVEVVLVPAPRIPDPRRLIEGMAGAGAAVAALVNELPTLTAVWDHLPSPPEPGIPLPIPPVVARTGTFTDSDTLTVSLPKTHVEAGAELFVRVAAGTSCAGEEAGGLIDAVTLDVTAEYDDDPGVDPLGKSQKQFHNRSDFRVVGAQGPLVIPYPAARVVVTGRVSHQGVIADDVEVRLVRFSCLNGLPAPSDNDSPYFGVGQLAQQAQNRLPAIGTDPLQAGRSLVEHLSELGCSSEVLASSTLAAAAGTASTVDIHWDSIAQGQPGQTAVVPPSLIAVVAEGRTPIDPDVITISSADGTKPFVEAVVEGAGVPDIWNPTQASTATEARTFRVPASVTWRRLVPAGGTWKSTVLQGAVSVSVPFAPATWSAGSDPAHLVVQVEGRVFRTPLGRAACPSLTPTAECDCPDPAQLQCLDGSCFGVDALLRCGARATFICPPAGGSRYVEPPCGPIELYQPPVCVPELGCTEASWQCLLNVSTDSACVPSSCTACREAGYPTCAPPPDPCQLLQNLPVGVFPATATISGLGDFSGKTAFVSLEPPRAALTALWPDPWNVAAIVEKLTEPPPDPVQWALGQVVLTGALGPVPTVLFSSGGNSPPGNVLIPDATYGLPLPMPLFSTVGAAVTEGWRGWSYGEFTPGPEGVPGLRRTIEDVVRFIPDGNPGMVFSFEQNRAHLERMRQRVTELAAAQSDAAAFAVLQNLRTDAESAFAPQGMNADKLFTASEQMLQMFNVVPQIVPARPTREGTPRYEGFCPESRNEGVMVQPGRCVPELPVPSAPVLQTSLPDIKARMMRLAACPVGAPRVSVTAGANVGGGIVVVGQSAGFNGSQQFTDYRDMNGDGIPDLVVYLPTNGPVGPFIVLRSNRRPTPGFPVAPSLFGLMPAPATSVSAHQGFNTDLKEFASRGGRGGFPGVSIPGSPSPSFGHSMNAEAVTLSDVNGDGLPDWVSGVGACAAGGLTVHLNLGERFDQAPRCWAGAVPLLDGLENLRLALPGVSPLSFGVGMDAAVQVSGAGSKNPAVNGAHLSVNVSRSDQLWEMHDINGDGLVDRVAAFTDSVIFAWLNTGSGFVPVPVPWRSPSWLNVAAAAGAERWAELEGTDGLTLQTPAGEQQVVLGRRVQKLAEQGFGAWLDVQCPDGPSACTAVRGFANRMLGGPVTQDPLSTSITLGIGAGAGFTGTIQEDIQIGPIPVLFAVQAGGSGNLSASLRWSSAQFMDINGDGVPEPVRAVGAGPVSALVVKPNQVAGGNKLNSIKNPLGGVIEIEYIRKGNTFEMPQSRWVMKAVRLRSDVKNGVAATGQALDARVEGGSHTRYSFKNGRYDRLNKSFLGFADVRVEEVDLVTGSGVRCTSDHYDTSHYERQGLLLRRTLHAGWMDPEEEECVGAVLAVTEHTYERQVVEEGVRDERFCPLPAPLPPEEGCRSTAHFAKRTTQTQYEDGAVSAQVRTDVQSYDPYGNVTLFRDEGDVADPADDLVMSVDYRAAGELHLASLPVRVRVAHGGSGGLLRVREGIYDSRGHLTEWAQLGESTRLATQYAYDAFGNLSQVTAPTGYQVTINYDDVTHAYPRRVADNLDGFSETVWDLRHGVPVEKRDANGSLLKLWYDGRGRLARVYAPGDAEAVTGVDSDVAGEKATVLVDYSCAGMPANRCARTLQKVPEQGRLETYAYVDGLGRPVLTAKTAELASGVALAVQGRHGVDGLGRKRLIGLVQVPLNGVADFADKASETPVALRHPTRVEVDLKDRPVRIDQPADAIKFFTTVTEYSAVVQDGVPRLLTRVTDPNGQRSESVKDVAEELTLAVHEFPRGPQQAPAVTSYVFNALNELQRIRDARGNETSFTYDKLGRQTSVTMPDTGRTETLYDVAGRVKETKDARGAIVRRHYEANSARVTRMERILEGLAHPPLTFTYGRSGAAGRGVGRLIASADEDGTEAYTYDALGNVSSVTRTLTSLPEQPSFTTQMEWDAFGRATTLTYPDGEALRYRYDRGGQVRRAEGSRVYVADIKYDEFGARTKVQFGNGVVQEFTHNEFNRRVDLIAANHGGRGLMHHAVTYDPVGNILRIAGELENRLDPELVPASITHEYGYDPLHRLTSASTELQLQSGRKRQESSFGYDEIHNVVSKDQRAFDRFEEEIGSERQSFRYEYLPGRPHTLTAINPGGASTQDFSYVHDVAGYLTRSKDFRGTRSFTWTADGMLRQVDTGDDTVSFRYDAGGNRRAKLSTKTGAIHFLGPQASVTPDGLNKHVFVGGSRVATVVEAGSAAPFAVTYLMDHIGSTLMLLDEGGHVREQVVNYPYGAPFHEARQAQVEPLRQRFLFTGQMLDQETGYHWFQDAQFQGGGRYLDSGRVGWLSPDPLWHEQGPMGLNVYQYAFWNPIKFVDPDGRVVVLADSEAQRRVDSAYFNNPAFAKRYDELDASKVRVVVRSGDLTRLGREPYSVSEFTEVRSNDTEEGAEVLITLDGLTQDTRNNINKAMGRGDEHQLSPDEVVAHGFGHAKDLVGVIEDTSAFNKAQSESFKKQQGMTPNQRAAEQKRLDARSQKIDERAREVSKGPTREKTAVEAQNEVRSQEGRAPLPPGSIEGY